MLAVIEPMARFIQLAIARVSQTSRRLEVTSRPAIWPIRTGPGGRRSYAIPRVKFEIGGSYGTRTRDLLIEATSWEMVNTLRAVGTNCF